MLPITYPVSWQTLASCHVNMDYQVCFAFSLPKAAIGALSQFYLVLCAGIKEPNSCPSRRKKIPRLHLVIRHLREKWDATPKSWCDLVFLTRGTARKCFVFVHCPKSRIVARSLPINVHLVHCVEFSSLNVISCWAVNLWCCAKARKKNLKNKLPVRVTKRQREAFPVFVIQMFLRNSIIG